MNVKPLKTLEQIKLDAIVERLIVFDGHREQTARSLGIDRHTLSNFMTKNICHPIIKMYRSRDFSSRINSPSFWIPRD